MIRSSDPVVEFSGYYLAGASQTGSSYYDHRAFCRLRWQSQIGQSTKNRLKRPNTRLKWRTKRFGQIKMIKMIGCWAVIRNSVPFASISEGNFLLNVCKQLALFLSNVRNCPVVAIRVIKVTFLGHNNDISLRSVRSPFN